MAKNCSCPIGFNVFIGIFLIALSFVGWIKILSVIMPTWLTLTCLILGLLMIILNTINKNYSTAENMTVEQTNKMHANEGF